MVRGVIGGIASTGLSRVPYLFLVILSMCRRPHPIERQGIDGKDKQDNQEPVPPEKTNFTNVTRFFGTLPNIPAPSAGAQRDPSADQHEQDNKRKEYQYFYDHRQALRERLKYSCHPANRLYILLIISI
jgi:hypothetical protein